MTQDNRILTLGEAEQEDFREATSCLLGNKDENNEEEEPLSEAIALSDENDEEELLRQAIAMSLED